MKKKNKFQNTENLRQSQPDMLNEEFVGKYIEQENLSIIEKININLAKNRTINKICKKIKLDPIYLLMMFLVPIIILLFTFFNFTTTMISTLYPLYQSYKTLQYQVNKSKVDGKLYKKEDEDNNTTQWLSYWLMYAFVNNTECILGSLVDKIPLYKLLKFIFFIACFLPQVQLSVVIYNYFTSKVYKLYGENFEKTIVNFMRNIFPNKNEEEEEQNPYKEENSKELINDDFGKRKKNE